MGGLAGYEAGGLLVRTLVYAGTASAAVVGEIRTTSARDATELVFQRFARRAVSCPSRAHTHHFMERAAEQRLLPLPLR